MGPGPPTVIATLGTATFATATFATATFATATFATATFATEPAVLSVFGRRMGAHNPSARGASGAARPRLDVPVPASAVAKGRITDPWPRRRSCRKTILQR